MPSVANNDFTVGFEDEIETVIFVEFFHPETINVG